MSDLSDPVHLDEQQSGVPHPPWCDPHHCDVTAPGDGTDGDTWLIVHSARFLDENDLRVELVQAEVRDAAGELVADLCEPARVAVSGLTAHDDYMPPAEAARLVGTLTRVSTALLAACRTAGGIC